MMAMKILGVYDLGYINSPEVVFEELNEESSELPV
jgi:hypothetical protein